MKRKNGFQKKTNRVCFVFITPKFEGCFKNIKQNDYQLYMKMGIIKSITGIQTQRRSQPIGFGWAQVYSDEFTEDDGRAWSASFLEGAETY